MKNSQKLSSISLFDLFWWKTVFFELTNFENSIEFSQNMRKWIAHVGIHPFHQPKIGLVKWFDPPGQLNYRASAAESIRNWYRLTSRESTSCADDFGKITNSSRLLQPSPADWTWFKPSPIQLEKSSEGFTKPESFIHSDPRTLIPVSNLLPEFYRN